MRSQTASAARCSRSLLPSQHRQTRTVASESSSLVTGASKWSHRPCHDGVSMGPFPSAPHRWNLHPLRTVEHHLTLRRHPSHAQNPSSLTLWASQRYHCESLGLFGSLPVKCLPSPFSPIASQAALSPVVPLTFSLLAVLFLCQLDPG